MEYKYSVFTKELIGAAMEVHKTLGNGFQEVIYQRAYYVELQKRNFIVAREVGMPVLYKDVNIGSRRVDFLFNNLISVEIKAIVKLETVQLAQALNYLEAFNLEVGLLINFGSRSLEFHRLLNKKYIYSSVPSNQNAEKSSS